MRWFFAPFRGYLTSALTFAPLRLWVRFSAGLVARNSFQGFDFTLLEGYRSRFSRQ